VSTPLGVAVTASSHQLDVLAEFQQKLEQRKLTSSQGFAYLQKMQDTALMLQINLRRAEKLMRQFKETAAHQTRTESSPVAFHELVVNLLASLSPVTQQIPVQPEVYIDPSLMLITDVDVWLQILTNLVMNSCRHAFEGIAMPGIRIQAYRNAQQELQFEYRDNGVGMSPAVIDRVFEPFFTTKAEQGGTGLGMSILKRLVEKKLQGTLQLQSSEGQGICLTINCLA
jgi:signal transduction histidine kinase